MELLQAFLSPSNRIYDLNLSNNLSITQQLDKAFQTNISSNLILTQTVNDLEIYLRSFSHPITFLQKLSRIQQLAHSFLFSQTFSRTVTYNISLTQTIQLRSITEEKKIVYPSITHSLTLNQKISRNFIVNHSLNIIQNISQTKKSSRIFNQTLNFSSIFHIQTRLNFNLSDTIVFYSNNKKRSQIGGQIITIPPFIVNLVPRVCRVILSTPQKNIVLPCPLFGDDEGLLSTLNIKRTMTTNVYTYIKQTDLNKLSYTFKISTKKARELRKFLMEYMSNIINVNNWKGEIWVTQITNNPVEEISKELAFNCDEFIETTLEFEGICLSR